jgi:hypothetical protein
MSEACDLVNSLGSLVSDVRARLSDGAVDSPLTQDEQVRLDSFVTKWTSPGHFDSEAQKISMASNNIHILQAVTKAIAASNISDPETFLKDASGNYHSVKMLLQAASKTYAPSNMIEMYLEIASESCPSLEMLKWILGQIDEQIRSTSSAFETMEFPCLRALPLRKVMGLSRIATTSNSLGYESILPCTQLRMNICRNQHPDFRKRAADLIFMHLAEKDWELVVNLVADEPRCEIAREWILDNWQDIPSEAILDCVVAGLCSALGDRDPLSEGEISKWTIPVLQRLFSDTNQSSDSLCKNSGFRPRDLGLASSNRFCFGHDKTGLDEFLTSVGGLLLVACRYHRLDAAFALTEAFPWLLSMPVKDLQDGGSEFKQDPDDAVLLINVCLELALICKAKASLETAKELYTRGARQVPRRKLEGLCYKKPEPSAEPFDFRNLISPQFCDAPDRMKHIMGPPVTQTPSVLAAFSKWCDGE